MTAFASLTAAPLRNDGDHNPRWRACKRSIGRDPTQLEFGKWCQNRWDDYFAELGLGELKGCARSAACKAHGRAFEAWLGRR